MLRSDPHNNYQTSCWCTGPWVLIFPDISRPLVAGECQQPLDDQHVTDRSQDMSTTGHLWDTRHNSCHTTLGTVEELSDALTQVWEEIPQKTTRRCGSAHTSGVILRAFTEAGSACRLNLPFQFEYPILSKLIIWISTNHTVISKDFQQEYLIHQHLGCINVSSCAVFHEARNWKHVFGTLTSLPVALWPPSLSHMSGTMADRQGPHTPGTKRGCSLIWRGHISY